MMKLAFLMMLRRGYLLFNWVHHSSQYVPKCQVYVINQRGALKVDGIATGCSMTHLTRDEADHSRWSLLAHLTNGLLAFFDREICKDVDELPQ